VSRRYLKERPGYELVLLFHGLLFCRWLRMRHKENVCLSGVRKGTIPITSGFKTKPGCDKNCNLGSQKEKHLIHLFSHHSLPRMSTPFLTILIPLHHSLPFFIFSKPFFIFPTTFHTILHLTYTIPYHSSCPLHLCSDSCMSFR
jgi:hypothetical protein